MPESEPMHPEVKKALEFVHWKSGDCLRKGYITPEDFWEILVAGIAPLLRAIPELIIKFLKFLGKFCEEPQVQEEAGKKSSLGAWGLKQFARIVRRM